MAGGRMHLLPVPTQGPQRAAAVECRYWQRSSHPYRCEAFKRFLAEGGKSSNNATEKQYLQSVLHFPPTSGTRPERK